MHSASIRIDGAVEVLDAIGPEMSEDVLRGSGTRVLRDGNDLVIEIEAADSTALRAAITSSLRYVSAATLAIDAIDNEKEE